MPVPHLAAVNTPRGRHPAVSNHFIELARPDTHRLPPLRARGRVAAMSPSPSVPEWPSSPLSKSRGSRSASMISGGISPLLEDRSSISFAASRPGHFVDVSEGNKPQPISRANSVTSKGSSVNQRQTTTKMVLGSCCAHEKRGATLPHPNPNACNLGILGQRRARATTVRPLHQFHGS